MKLFGWLALLILLSGGLLYYLNEKGSFDSWKDELSLFLGPVEPVVEKVEPKEVTFPFARTIVDVNNRRLEANVIAKKTDAISIERVSDGKRFVIQLSSLSADDQAYFDTIPNSVLPISQEQATPSKVPRGRIAQWHSDILNAERESAKLGLPMLVLCTGTGWSSLCQKFDREVFSHRNFRTFANQELVLMRVEVDRGYTDTSSESAVLARFNATVFPTVILVTPEGKNIFRKSGGFIQVEIYISQLRAAIARNKGR